MSAAPRPSSPWREATAAFARSPAALGGLAVLVVVVGATLFGPMLYDVDPFDMVGMPLLPPGEEAPLGTDYLGRDVLAGILSGGRATLAVGVCAALLSVLIGVTIGALAGYFGGAADAALMRVVEFFQVLPTLLFAMVLVTLFRPTLTVVALAIGVVTWTGTARLARAEFLRIKGLDYVKAARAGGAGHAYLVLRTILPNGLPPLIVSATLAIGVAILFEGGLSFLGLGDPNVMSWGLMIGQNRNNMTEAWWAVTFPGLAIFLTVLAVGLVGDGVNDALNPRLRSR